MFPGKEVKIERTRIGGGNMSEKGEAKEWGIKMQLGGKKKREIRKKKQAAERLGVSKVRYYYVRKSGGKGGMGT